METILQDHNNNTPAREVLVAIAEKFSNSPDRKGKFLVQTKQIWNWFQNKRYAIRAKSSETPTKLTVSSMKQMSRMKPPLPVPLLSTMPAMQETPDMPVVPSAYYCRPRRNSKGVHLFSYRSSQPVAASSGNLSADNIPMEFEARSARDGAWYDVTAFLSIKNLEAGDPEVLVRFTGFGPEEDEWINVIKNVRHRSLPCEPFECVAVLPGDLILCFQEIVQLRKICRRPETDYRLQKLHVMNESSAEQGKSALYTEHKVVPSAEQIKADVDLSFSKEGISNSLVLSVQNCQAPNLFVNSAVSEDLKGATDCSTDNTTLHSHPVVINLDPGIEAEKSMLEVKDATDYMAVDERVDTSCLTAEKKQMTCLCVELMSLPNYASQLIRQREMPEQDGM